MPSSNDAILVLNAGSSSIKLSVFAADAGGLTVELRGQIEGLYVAPRFAARDLAGRVVAESRGRERRSVTTGRSNISGTS